MIVDPACIPELAKVILLVLSTASNQTNGHKLSRLKTAFNAVNEAMEVSDTEALREWRHPDDCLRVWASMYSILSDYGELFDWLDKMDKKQQFFNFWTVRSRINTIHKKVRKVEQLIHRANIRSGCDKGHMLSMVATYDELSAKNKGELTPAQKHENKLKEMETKIEVEKTVASVRKLLTGLEAADDRDLVEYQATRDKISASLAMILGQSSTASSSSGGMNETTPILDTSKIVQSFLNDEEKREVERAQGLCEESHAEPEAVADGNVSLSLDVEFDINNSEIDCTLSTDDID